jgi:integrase/recombinase XerD
LSENVLEDQVERYLEWKRTDASIKTSELYRAVLVGVWLPWCGRANLSEPSAIDDKAMVRFTEYLGARKRPLAIPTIRSYVRDVRTFLNWAGVERGRYHPPKQPKRLLNVLSRQEIDLMESAATNERDRLIIRVLGDTGIRVGELLGIRRIDLREGAHSYLVRVIGKGDKEREVGLPETTYKRLKQFAEPGRADAWLFVGQRRRGGEATPLTVSGARQVVKGLAREARIERRIWPHLFRHSYASHQLIRGVSPIILQKHLGHESLAMISQTYGHILADDSYSILMDGLRK